MGKECNKCFEVLSLDSFHKHKKHKDGLSYTCKECAKALTKKWSAANPEKVTENNKKYYDANTSKLIVDAGLWRENNKAKSAASNGMSRCVGVYGVDSVHPEYSLELCIPFYRERIRLEELTGVRHDVDHIVSLSSGGLHHQENLQVLTHRDNILKYREEQRKRK